jgi:acetyltransferase-like isoleucine patch superfamily enzyme
VTIGKGSIIGANAVVLHDVPPNSLAIGFPAKIKKLDEQQE